MRYLTSFIQYYSRSGHERSDGWEGGVQVGGRKITNLRYADDIVFLAGSESELQVI